MAKPVIGEEQELRQRARDVSAARYAKSQELEQLRASAGARLTEIELAGGDVEEAQSQLHRRITQLANELELLVAREGALLGMAENVALDRAPVAFAEELDGIRKALDAYDVARGAEDGARSTVQSIFKRLSRLDAEYARRVAKAGKSWPDVDESVMRRLVPIVGSVNFTGKPVLRDGPRVSVSPPA